jgi:hypothetical protein
MGTALAGVAAIAVAAILLGLPGATSAQIRPAESAPACVQEAIVLVDAVNSATARIGDVFRFRTVNATTASDGTAIPANTLGYGIVAAAAHAQRGGRGGYLALEPRLLTLGDGRRLSVIADRAGGGSSTATGSSRNASGFLGAVPFLGYGLGAYGYLHHGADITIPAGTRLSVLIGDDAALGACRIYLEKRPSPSPSASASR